MDGFPMLRFPKYRWTLILALAALAALGTTRGAVAGSGDPNHYGDPEPPLPNPGAGDPDVPNGKSSTTAWNGYQKRWTIENRRVGDARALRGDGVWRLILILRGVRS